MGHQKYRITAKVGHGAFGDVYSGIDVSSDEEVAIKLENTSSKTN